MGKKVHFVCRYISPIEHFMIYLSRWKITIFIYFFNFLSFSTKHRHASSHGGIQSVTIPAAVLLDSNIGKSLHVNVLYSYGIINTVTEFTATSYFVRKICWCSPLWTIDQHNSQFIYQCQLSNCLNMECTSLKVAFAEYRTNIVPTTLAHTDCR